MSFEYAPAIALLPLVSFAIALTVGSRMPKKGAFAGIAATGGSLLLSLLAVRQVAGGEHHNEELLVWAGAGAGTELELTFGILIDPLSALMLIIVSLVAFLVHVFSLGYMNDEGEVGLPRYYAGLGLFTFSMLAFVYASNLLQAFMFFELVGLCSWLLIGFWFREAAPPSAAKKAFLVTRFGDFFFLVGVVGVAVTFAGATETPLAFAGAESFPVVAEEVVEGSMGAGELATFGFAPQTWFTILGLLVLGGVVGKSAQFPLHTWLPDAMEGPTPVSALIHAATMVAAGVFLVARMYGFYAVSPQALAIIAFVGGFTALFAATMGVVKDEIKQVLAYSTISQYGYMMLALGAGGYIAGVFHLMTHAFFKALLFLGAGSVIIAMHHEEDMWKMGGLKQKMPVTYWTFLAGSLALAGIFPFAGFWSKDEVLFEALVHGLGASPFLLAAYAMGLLAVPVTAFYTFRMVSLTFHGEARTEAAEDPHGVRWNVKFPLVVLGVLATVAGFLNMVPVVKLLGASHLGPIPLEALHDWLAHGIEGVNAEHYTLADESLTHEFAGYTAGYVGSELVTTLLSAGLSLGLAVVGAIAGYRLYDAPDPTEHTDRLGSMKTVLYDNYYQDEYQVWLAEGVTAPLAQLANRFDQGVVDGVVDGVSSVSLLSGSRVRRIQTGVVSNYAALITAGLIVLLIAVGVLGGWF
ncbi:NADH-quinone oxidoreductase subunit L [Halobacteriales archaeon QS_8_69_26]|nr:MAG: NADH-quinone oxidoreductase subunit L [Halobacteriales archaeon QS_8_69_26]